MIVALIIILFIVVAVIFVAATTPNEYQPETIEASDPPYWKYTTEKSQQRDIRIGKSYVGICLASIALIFFIIALFSGCPKHGTPTYGSENYEVMTFDYPIL